MTASRFAIQVAGLTNKSYYEVELEAALGYFANNHNGTHEQNAKDAWDAAHYFMVAMEKAWARNPAGEQAKGDR